MLSSDRIREPTRFGKAPNLIIPELSSLNMRGFDHVTILSPSFHGLRKDAWHNDPVLCPDYTKKNALQIMSLAAYASETKKNCDNLSINKEKLAYVISYNRHI